MGELNLLTRVFPNQNVLYKLNFDCYYQWYFLDAPQVGFHRPASNLRPIQKIVMLNDLNQFILLELCLIIL